MFSTQRERGAEALRECAILSANEESACAEALTMFKHRARERIGETQSFFDADFKNPNLFACGGMAQRAKRRSFLPQISRISQMRELNASGGISQTAL